MPCPAWGISATRCRVGRVLAARPGTVCSHCYALKGRYLFPAVQRKLEERYRGMFHPLWVPAMAFLVRWHADRHFRWFDSGDVQGKTHLRNIAAVCRQTRDVLHWLPTREADAVRACAGELPDNLTVRLSANRVDGPPPAWWPTTSTVVSGQDSGDGVCPAPDQDGACDDCRGCWDPGVPNVAYRRH